MHYPGRIGVTLYPLVGVTIEILIPGKVAGAWQNGFVSRSIPLMIYLWNANSNNMRREKKNMQVRHEARSPQTRTQVMKFLSHGAMSFYCLGY
jgi:hypothetical protein